MNYIYFSTNIDMAVKLKIELEKYFTPFIKIIVQSVR